jgi:catechol 2,3-dioxygenase-like lactoylglutathione lyase family enzyme
MDWKLEVVVVPVSDVDKAYEFYVDKLGFRLDTDVMTPGPEQTRADYGSFLYFDDPDGNTWAVQEIRHHAR